LCCFGGQVESDVKKFGGGACKEKSFKKGAHPFPHVAKVFHTSRCLVTKCSDVWGMVERKRAACFSTDLHCLLLHTQFAGSMEKHVAFFRSV
jgi:hypothetical protein